MSRSLPGWRFKHGVIMMTYHFCCNNNPTRNPSDHSCPLRDGVCDMGSVSAVWQTSGMGKKTLWLRAHVDFDFCTGKLYFIWSVMRGNLKKCNKQVGACGVSCLKSCHICMCKFRFAIWWVHCALQVEACCHIIDANWKAYRLKIPSKRKICMTLN